MPTTKDPGRLVSALHNRALSAPGGTVGQSGQIGRQVWKAAPLLYLTLAGAAQANRPPSGGPLAGAQIERLAYPFSSIGLVESRRPVVWRDGQKVRRHHLSGTAFMISPCYALTAFHVVFGNDPARARAAAPHAVWISFNRVSRRFTLDRVKAKVVAWGDYADDAAQDWALLQVTGCPGARPDIGWLELEPDNVSIENRPAQVGGFGSSNPPSRPMTRTECRFGRRTGRITIAHRCVGEPGMSGAPIMVGGDDHKPKVAALVSRRLLINTPPQTALQPLQLDLAVVVQPALIDPLYYAKILADRPTPHGPQLPGPLSEDSGRSAVRIATQPTGGKPPAGGSQPIPAMHR